ncbi:MAG: hypothetical protein ACLTXL_11705 [Clostridia bacterium]
MYRIGIIGTENSHAITFAKLLNLPDEQGRYRHEDARIVGVYGPDMESAQEIVEKTGSPLSRINRKTSSGRWTQ